MFVPKGLRWTLSVHALAIMHSRYQLMMRICVCWRVVMCECVHVWSSQLSIGLSDLVFVESCIIAS